MFLLSKLLPLFVYPLGITIILCIFSLLLLWVRRRRLAMFLLIISVVVLWGSSTTVVAEFVLASLERHYPPVTIQMIPSTEAIVILGGMTRGVVPGTGLTDLSGGVDRLVTGARLYKAGKAPVIILSGGGAEGFQPESEAMAEILEVMGIPSEILVLESESRNTLQNGANTVRILKERGMSRIILVTSAIHMSRAQAVFESLGVSVIPAATDYQVVERFASVLDWLPQASALEMTTKGIKEYIGYWIYGLR